jgi:prolipoprotein diacylglyceryltransferase
MLGLILMAVMVILIILIIVFWLWMLIDCLKRDFDKRIAWVLILIFLGILGALLYYFMIKRKNISTEKQ